MKTYAITKGGQRWARAVWSDGSPVDMSGTDEDLAARVVE
jgi:hypothetical protein